MFKNKCPQNSIIRIPTELDNIMNHKSSIELKAFLANDKFDIAKVGDDIQTIFKDIYKNTKEKLEDKY